MAPAKNQTKKQQAKKKENQILNQQQQPKQQFNKTGLIKIASNRNPNQQQFVEPTSSARTNAARRSEARRELPVPFKELM